MSSVAIYRSLVPLHASVADATVEVYLELAAKRHNAAAFGDVYPEAMVFYAAHTIERTPGLVTGSGGASQTGELLQQKDDLLQRTFGQAAGAMRASQADASLRTTRYGLLYLELRDSRAAVRPLALRVV